MSELITRRTFLKATGAAALVAAAGSMLVGCDGGLDALLNSPSMPSVNSESCIYANTGYTVGMGAFYNCRSNSQHESSSTQCYYLYTLVSFHDVPSPVLLKTSDFQFSFDKAPFNTSKPSCTSIGNFTLNSTTNKYVPVTSRTILTGNSSIPLWINLGSYTEIPTSHIGAFSVTYKNAVVFNYANPSFDPTPSKV